MLMIVKEAVQVKVYIKHPLKYYKNYYSFSHSYLHCFFCKSVFGQNKRKNNFSSAGKINFLCSCACAWLYMLCLLNCSVHFIEYDTQAAKTSKAQQPQSCMLFFDENEIWNINLQSLFDDRHQNWKFHFCYNYKSIKKEDIAQDQKRYCLIKWI